MQTAKDKRNLVAAIMGAIITYTQMEQQTPSVVRDVQPQPKVSQWKTTEESSHKRQRG